MNLGGTHFANSSSHLFAGVMYPSGCLARARAKRVAGPLGVDNERSRRTGDVYSSTDGAFHRIGHRSDTRLYRQACLDSKAPPATHQQ
jgi:hypothetical protein